MRARLAVAAAVSGVVIALAGCASTPAPQASSPSLTVQDVAARHVDGLPTAALSSGHAREVYSVGSISDFVKLSDLVVVGTAIAIAPGRVVGDASGGQLQWRDVAVEVEEVIHGDYDAQTLTLEELGWHEGKPMTINHASWAERGDRMLLGLKRANSGEGIGGERFGLTSTATRFYLTPDGGVEGNYVDVDDSEIRAFVYVNVAKGADELLADVRAER